MSDSQMKIFISQRCVLEDGVFPVILLVVNGRINKIIRNAVEQNKNDIFKIYPDAIVEDFGNNVLMAGIVDSHVHVNDPGRTDWEGFWTATRAAAAGGVTTIVDMPLNSIPPTTTLSNLETKVNVARNNAFVDIAFWGGVIPGNEKHLKPMISAGVVGFKCFLLPSGIEEFPHVSLEDVEKALEELKSTESVLAFHAECEGQYNENSKPINQSNTGDPGDYENFLVSRPASMEVQAIEKVAAACKSSGVRCHIVHLSAAEALDIVADAKKKGAPLTAETCHHYLILEASKVPHGATEYKCCPPIRGRENQEKLWRGLKNGTLDMIVSDHSPCTENLKTPGNFITAWGGISSLQFGLSLMWTGARERHFSLTDVSTFLSANPAKLCGLGKRKGKIVEDADADFVVWMPEEKYTTLGFEDVNLFLSLLQVLKSDILHKNKLTAYEGKELFGCVKATFLRGHCIYRNGKISNELMGSLLLRNT